MNEEVYGDLTARQRTLATYALLACAFLAMLDGSVIGTALPQIVKQVGGNDAWYLWLVTAYLLASSVSVPFYGRFSDLRGRRGLLLIGLGIFLVGSLACSLVGSMEALIVSRTVQGLGAGALITLCMATIRDLYPPSRMADMVRVQSVLAVMMVAGMVGGPLIGGLLTDHVGWRSIFLVNLPIGGAALAAIVLVLPSRRPTGVTSGRLDVAGIALLASGLSTLLIGLSLKTQRTGGEAPGWTDPVVALPLVIGVLLLLAMIPVEKRAATPVLPPHLLQQRTYRALLFAGFFFQASSMPIGFLFPVYLQQIRNVSTSVSALLVLPLLLGLAAGNRLSAAVMIKTGNTKPVLLAGAVLLTVGTGAFLFLDNGTSYVATSIWLVLIGLGAGPAMGGMMMAAQNSVPPADIGTATAGSALTKQIGGILGLSLCQSMLTSGGVGQVTGADMGAAIGWVGGGAALLALVATVVAGNVVVRAPGPPKTAKPQPADAEAAA
ncbi:MFS transporter [Kitasatospora sp. NPDC089509]|uniref:MFS transporter n=1 Tax=Kitasatospora sp. NPDC089509 TaxID=3364079 RepID=UPI003824EC20